MSDFYRDMTDASNLPVVAWRRFSKFTGWYFWGDEPAEPGSSDAQDLTPRDPAQAIIADLRREIYQLKRTNDSYLAEIQRLKAKGNSDDN